MEARSSRQARRVAAAIASLAVIGMVISGCAAGDQGRPAASASQDEARQAVFAQLELRADAGMAINVAKSLAEFLPNRLFSSEGEEPAPKAAGIVVGHVTAVSEGRAYVVVGDDADSDTEVPFDTKDPLWQTIDVTLEISQGWGEFTDASTVSFAAFVDGSEDPQSVMNNYSKLGQIIVVLGPAGDYTYDPTLYRVAGSSTLIGTVGDDGTISFPAKRELEEEFLHETPTLDDLDTAAAEDEVIVTRE